MHRFAAIALCFLSSAALAQDKWGGYLDFEAKPGTKRSLGEADLFVPLWQDGRNLVFGNLRGRFDDGDGREGNLGLGLRRMYESGWNVGGYVYFDRRKSENGFYYSQATFGGEALGRDWDLRANAYLPQGERVHDLGTADTASVSGTTVLVSSVTTQERALKGFDVEAGWRVPLFAVDEPRQLRLYAGGYRFKDDVAEVSGPRVRAELTMAQTPWLWQGAQLVASVEAQDDDLRGGQTFFALRLRVPLGGKEQPRALTWQERRMTAPVVRDVDIVAPAVALAPVIETATALADGRAFAVLNSLTIADLPAAVTAAGTNSVVILSGTFNTGASPVVLQTGQTLAGAVDVRTASGRIATTPSAAINATVSGGAAVDAANNSTIIGLTLRNTGAGAGARGIGVIGVTGVTIANNTISASDLGSNSSNGIVVNTAASATITGNNINIVGNRDGIATAINVLGAGSTVTVANNILSASGATDPTRNRFLGFQAGTIVNTAASTGNTAAAGGCLNAGAIGFVSFTDGTTCP